jgi:serine/threonine-protein kinase
MRVVLSDFGIARSLTGELHLTTGALGTPTYMAPEQAAGGPIDERTDLYSLGLVLFEILTGARPLGPPGDLASELEEVGAPAACAAVILRCIERDPAARPRSAEEVRGLLAQAFPETFAASGAPRSARADRASHAHEPPAPPGASRVSALSLPGSLTGQRALAVLPLRYFGAPDQAYLGDVLTEELVDVLSRTRGLRVLGTGATAKYRDTRDPQQISRELGVRSIVDGTAQCAGDKLRISARLIDAEHGGVQLWSQRYEGSLADVFELQTSIARRVAEELRVELTTLSYGSGLPAEAIELYLTARSRLRGAEYTGVIEAVGLLARSIAIAPDFGPALAAHTYTCVRGWFLSMGTTGAPDWEALARASVEQAKERAPDLAETHYAAGMLAAQYGNFAEAVRSLVRALLIAPTYAAAHEYLGMLECEAGRSESGVKRLLLSAELDPTLTYGLVYLARHHALSGDHEACEAAFTELARRRGPEHFTVLFARIRLAGWRRDKEELTRLLEITKGWTMPARLTAKLCAQAHLGQIAADEVERLFAHYLGEVQNPRMITLITQLRIEVHASSGRPEVAMMHLFRAATSVLVDLDWLDRCPLLAELRAMPRFNEARCRVQARANAIWTH